MAADTRADAFEIAFWVLEYSSASPDPSCASESAIPPSQLLQAFEDDGVAVRDERGSSQRRDTTRQLGEVGGRLRGNGPLRPARSPSQSRDSSFMNCSSVGNRRFDCLCIRRARPLTPELARVENDGSRELCAVLLVDAPASSSWPSAGDRESRVGTGKDEDRRGEAWLAWDPTFPYRTARLRPERRRVPAR